MRGPRSSGGAQRVGGGPSSSGLLWTPDSAAPLGDFDGDVGVTGSGASIAWASRYGSASLATGSSRPTLNAAALNGHAGWTLAAGSQLYTTAGGLSGSVPFTQHAVGRAAPSGSTYGNLALLGSVGARANTAYGSAIVGATYAGAWWGGGNNGANTFPSGGTADALDHVFTTDFTTWTSAAPSGSAGNLARVFVDGVLIAEHANPFVLTAGMGICPWNASGYGTAGRLYRYIPRSGSDSTALRHKHIQYLAARYGLTITGSDRILTLGNSLSFGLGTTTPSTDSYPAQLAAALPGWTYSLVNTGTSGATAAQILALPANAPLLAATAPGWKNNFAIIEAGTNDAFQNISTATAIANAVGPMATMKTTLEALGYTVLFGTVFPWVNGSPSAWFQATADGINAWIAANVAPGQIVRWDLTPELALTGSGTTYDGVYRLNSTANIGHPTTAGATVMARDAAAKLLALKQ